MISQLMAVTGVPNYRDLLFAIHTLLSYSRTKPLLSKCQKGSRMTVTLRKALAFTCFQDNTVRL